LAENETQGEWTLPDGWVWTTLGEITEPSKEKVNPQGIQRTPYIGLEHIERNTGRLLIFGYSDEVRSTKAVFQRGDLLYGKLRPYLNKVHIADFDGVCSTDILVFPKSPHISNRCLLYRLLSSDFVRYANLNVSGVQHPRTNFKILSNFPLALPPAAEQRRIVAEIETQFTRLDAGVAALERAQANLRRYKASVLKTACEGRLVPTEAELARAEGRDYEPADQLLVCILAERCARWETEHPGKRYKEPALPDTEGLPELPEGWVWASLPQLGELNRGKSKHRPRNNERLFGGPYPFIQTGEIRQAEGTIATYSQTYSEFGLAQSRLWPKGTLCITIAANIAETAILGFDGCFPDSVVGFIPEDGVDVRFVEYFIRTAKQDLERYAPATAQKNINLRTLRGVAVPLPPLAEQRRIVEEVERRLSVVAALEASVEASLARARRLRQAVLKQAFEGRLVEQDPSDEPASVLLERIKAEKARGSTARRVTAKSKGRGRQSTRKEQKVEQAQQLEMF